MYEFCLYICLYPHVFKYIYVYIQWFYFLFFLEKHKLKAAKRVHKSNGGNKGIMLYLKKILTTISKAPELKY